MSLLLSEGGVNKTSPCLDDCETCEHNCELADSATTLNNRTPVGSEINNKKATEDVVAKGCSDTEKDFRLTPTPQPMRVAISGVSGRFPESESIEEFKQHLMNGDDMVTEDNRRWPTDMYDIPKRSGKLKNIEKFDASFFGVHPKQANTMDPQLRLLLEVAYEAIIDSGTCPNALRGSKTGVFVGCSSSEAHQAWMDIDKCTGYEMTGCTHTMFANRLSYFFDFKGPSFAIDTACSASLLALSQALESIRRGQCNAALVGGCSMCLSPHGTTQFQKLGVLSPDGACKSFDASANGYCRSEAVVCILLQKQEVAKRVYASVIHSDTNSDGHKEQGITFPSGETQKALLQKVYADCGVNPSQVVYVEAHGTGTKVGDPQEVNSIAEVFCNSTERSKPLLIGSTKSNMGHAEPASGLVSVAKVILAMESGIIPGNLHYENPNPLIPALTDGRLQVINKNTPWEGGFVGINSFGFGGSNVHVLLKSYCKDENHQHSTTETRLCTVSGRTQEGVEQMLKQMVKNANSVEMQALLQGNANQSVTSYPYRGFTILNSTESEINVQNIVQTNRPPVFYVFTGMGCQWSGMGKSVMDIDIFRESIMKSDQVLKKYGIDLYNMLVDGGENMYESPLNSFVGIIAVQIALVDTLHAIGFRPDGLLGHSVGELACAYVDGGLTSEEAIIVAYHRGRSVMEANLPPGAMAAVGLTWEEAKVRCPDGIVPACHNAKDTVTISGPLTAVKSFVEELQSEDIFARIVNSSQVAFHSPSMRQIEPSYRAALEQVIGDKKRPRSSKWISSSIPLHKDNERYSDVDYHVNNLLSPVLFQEAMLQIPNNAIVIEIAPHCLLKAILKRSLSSECQIFGLMKRNHENNVHFMLSNLGGIFMNGIDIDPMRLTAPITFPVAKGTPMLSPLVKWNHSENWATPHWNQFVTTAGNGKNSCVYEIDVKHNKADMYLCDHIIDGHTLFPATGYLMLAWRAMAKIEEKHFEKIPVAFEDVNIQRATILPSDGKLMFEVNINPGTQQFEILESNSLVASGIVYVPSEPVLQIPSPVQNGANYANGEENREMTSDEMGNFTGSALCLDNKTKVTLETQEPLMNEVKTPQASPPTNNHTSDILTSKDVYKELRVIGYDYAECFKGILSASNEATDGQLLWNGNWVTFMDTMLQVCILGKSGKEIVVPTRLKSLRIDPTIHKQKIIKLENKEAVNVTVDSVLSTCTAGGIEFHGLHTNTVPRHTKKQHLPILEHSLFIPNIQYVISENSLGDYVAKCNEIILQENLNNINNHKEENHNVIGKSDLRSVYKEMEILPNETLFKLLSSVTKLQLANADIIEIRKYIEETFHSLSNDKVVGILLSFDNVKSALDLAIENSGIIEDFKIAEFNFNTGRFYEFALPAMSTLPRFKATYKVFKADIETLDEDYKVKIEDMGIAMSRDVANQDVILLNQLLPFTEDELKSVINRMESCLTETGFIVIHCPTKNFGTLSYLKDMVENKLSADPVYFDPSDYCSMENIKDIINQTKFEIVAQKNSLVMSTLLIRRLENLQRSKTQKRIDVSDLKSYKWVQEINSAISDEECKDVILMAIHPNVETGLIGMVNCLRIEYERNKLRYVINLSNETICSDAIDKQLCLGFAVNVYKNGQWGTLRFQQLYPETKSTNHAYVNVLTKGDLSSLSWVESPLKHFQKDENPEKKICSVYYASVNFRDVMLATGKLPPNAIPGDLAAMDSLLGMEFSGRDEDGSRVMGIVPAQGLATVVAGSRELMWSVPGHWTLEQAATIPVVYTTAYYALIVRGGITAGDKVLIHSGSGGVGQAAIAIALHHNCEVFTTVGTIEKKQYLKDQFPQLKDVNIAYSHDTSFEWSFLRATQGKGIDVVLNSLAEDKLQASVRLLAKHGKFLEIGKADLAQNSKLGMAMFLKNITFHGILLDALFDDTGSKDWLRVSRLLSEGIKDGVVTPLQALTFSKDDTEKAFRFMARGKNIGKVIIKIKEEELLNSTRIESLPVEVSAIPMVHCNPKKCYVITGGLGGFGLELADWLIQRGARHLLLSTRSVVRNGYQRRCLSRWRKKHVNVSVSTNDVSKYEGAVKLMEEATAIVPVGGIFHLAVVLNDAMMENQSPEGFKIVTDPKVLGSSNLDLLTREPDIKKHLDYFVMFSSVVSAHGNKGQTNYGFANSYMDRICESRKNYNLPGTSIQWGVINDIGMASETVGNDTVIAGTFSQRIHSCLATLDQLLGQSKPVVTSFILPEKKVEAKTSGGNNMMIDSLLNVLGVSNNQLSTVNKTLTLGELGLDSLMGVEIKQILERHLQLIVPLVQIRTLTIENIQEMMIKK